MTSIINENTGGEVVVEDGEVAGTSHLRRSTRENLGRVPVGFQDFEMPSAMAQRSAVKSKILERQGELASERVERVSTHSHGASRPPSVISLGSVMSKASEARQKQKIEFESLKKLYELEEADRKARRKLIEQERLLKLAELEEIKEQNYLDEDFKSIISDKIEEKERNRTGDWISHLEEHPVGIISENKPETTIITSENDKIGEALLLMAKIQYEQANKSDMNIFMKRQVALTPLREFSGRAEEWLGFIQDFRSSTEMCGLKNEENLKRLCSCLRGKAKELFLEKLRSAEMVPKVIQQMEEIFGQPRLIIQSLIRKIKEMPFVKEDKPELLLNFAHTVDNLVDSMRIMNCPGYLENPQLMDEIVGKLPNPLKSRWADLVIEKEYRVNLEDLAKFLCQRARAANVLRNLESEEIETRKNKENFDEYIPIAVGLVNTDIEKGVKENCIFCDQPHPSYKCWNGIKMSPEEKKQCVMKKRVCFICLKSGHTARDCKSSIKCTTCGRKHYEVMCFKKQDDEKNLSTVVKDTTLSNQTANPGVILQTLLVNLMSPGNNKEKITVRALVDTGSQRSFLSNEFIKKMNYKPVEEIKIVHSLFGGVETKEVLHNRYKIRVGARDRDFICTFDVLNQKQICGEIPDIPQGPWMTEMRDMGIVISDIGHDRRKVDLLLGADVVGKLLTGRIRVTESGPVAVETYLGWSLVGKIPTEKSKNNSTLLVTSLFRKDENLESLWSLDSLVITDSIETECKEEIQDIKLSNIQNRSHIPGKDNPAEFPSRGCSISKLNESSWWEGPAWLKKSEQFWPKSKIDEDIVFDESEMMSVKILKTRKKNYQTFLHIVAWMLRFISNCKQTNRRNGDLSLEEIVNAVILTSRIIQSDSENNGMDYSKKLKIEKDQNDVLRVQTKIARSEDTELFRCPIVLPSSHAVVKLMFKDVHKQNSHAGVQVLMCMLREILWILRARGRIKTMLRTCIRCRRFEAKRMKTNTATLLIDCIWNAAVFEVTGVDACPIIF